MSLTLFLLLAGIYSGALWILARVVGFNRLGDDAE